MSGHIDPHSPLIPAQEMVLPTLQGDGKRRWINPALATGKYWQRRRLLAYGLIALSCSIPHTIRKLMETMLYPRGILLLSIPVYTAGILYGLLYWWKPAIVELPDKSHVRPTEIEFTSSDLDYALENPIIGRSTTQQN